MNEEEFTGRSSVQLVVLVHGKKIFRRKVHSPLPSQLTRSAFIVVVLFTPALYCTTQLMGQAEDPGPIVIFKKRSSSLGSKERNKMKDTTDKTLS